MLRLLSSWLYQSDKKLVYSTKELRKDPAKTIENVKNLISFNFTVLSKTAVFDSAKEVKDYLEYVKRKFKWFDYDQSSVDYTATFFCNDEKGTNRTYLTGYIIMSQRCNGKYYFRGSFVEFHERVTYEQMAYKVLVSAGAILTAAAAGAGTGASLGLGSAAGALVCGISAASAVIFTNIDDSQTRKSVEEKLGTDIYNARTNRVNGAAMMEALLLHYIISGQSYTISRNKVHIIEE